MALNFDQLLDASMKRKKKLLDLAKVKIKSDEEFEKYIDRMPDIKMKAEEASTYVQIVTDVSFVPSRKERVGDSTTTRSNNYSYLDPLPKSMADVHLEDLCAVDIPWKMLTDSRPISRIEEDYFNRLVDLGKFKRLTRTREAKLLSLGSTASTSTTQAKALALDIVVSKSKKGTVETRLKICRECGLELCTGAYCKDGLYDSFSRMLLDPEELEEVEAKEFSLKDVIKQATSKPDKKSDEKKVLERRRLKKGGHTPAASSTNKRHPRPKRTTSRRRKKTKE